MSIPATQLRPGMIIKHNNDLHSVFSVEHRTPGNLRAFIQAKLRNLRTGAMFVERFRSPDPIEKVTVDEVPASMRDWDQNHDGVIDARELELAVRQMGDRGNAILGRGLVGGPGKCRGPIGRPRESGDLLGEPEC